MDSSKIFPEECPSEIEDIRDCSDDDDGEALPNSPGKFVRRRLDTSSEDDGQECDGKHKESLKKRYKNLLAKYEKERRKKVKKNLSKRGHSSNSTLKPLAERIRGWQLMELEKIADHKEQYHSWLAFKSIVEENWEMYEVKDDREKLVCLQTKCKGFVSEWINSIYRVKPHFAEVWNGLHNQFAAPIDSGI